MTYFKGKQFQKDVIIVAVGYYLRYNLSYRDVQELLYDRGINVSHTTVYRWVQEYGKYLEEKKQTVLLFVGNGIIFILQSTQMDSHWIYGYARNEIHKQPMRF